MNQADYFKNEWQEMATSRVNNNRDREALFNRESKEVLHEMIFQECQEGLKSRQKIANEYKVHLTTVYRVEKKGEIDEQTN